MAAAAESAPLILPQPTTHKLRPNRPYAAKSDIPLISVSYCTAMLQFIFGSSQSFCRLDGRLPQDLPASTLYFSSM